MQVDGALGYVEWQDDRFGFGCGCRWIVEEHLFEFSELAQSDLEFVQGLFVRCDIWTGFELFLGDVGIGAQFFDGFLDFAKSFMGLGNLLETSEGEPFRYLFESWDVPE